MENDKYEKLTRHLESSIGKSSIYTDKMRRYAWGTSAGVYRITPRMVVKVKSEEDVKEVMSACKKLNVPLNFRGSGTSLSGQAVTDSVLVLVRDGWEKCQVENNGDRISLGIRVVGLEANEALRPYGKKIGPDPASLRAATIAGIVSNNSSGMTCGTALNAWNTIEGIRIILSDGTLLDTRDKQSRDNFLSNHADFIKKILYLSRCAKEDASIKERILKKYRIKNTIGYSVNSLVEFDDPFDIIAHLMVGSEGTLAFISEVTFKTVEDLPQKATSLMAFEDAATACKALLILKQQDVAAAEFMDRRTIAAVEGLPGVPKFLKELGPESATLLVETRAKTEEQLNNQVRAITLSLADIPMPVPITFYYDQSECRRLWEIREGFDPIIKAKATPGTTMVGEDIAIPIEHLGTALSDLYNLFEKWGYNETVVFGHALSGNLHYVMMQDFNSPQQMLKFKGLIEGLPEVVVDKYDGSLKAEHGTGRCMAPFVEREWGQKIYNIMKEIKLLFDPDGILNPGTIFTEDTEAHVHHLKKYSLLDREIDACIECGFCERGCVSHDLTLSPRHRIAIIRRLEHLKKSGENLAILKEIEHDLPYMLMTTCAVCGRCEKTCPSGISTGNYIKKLKAESANYISKYVAGKLANQINIATATARVGLSFAHGLSSILGEEFIQGCVSKVRDFPRANSKRWFTHLPKPTKALSIDHKPSTNKSLREIVYFPSCINRIMGNDPKVLGNEELISLVEKLCKRAGYQVRFAKNTENLCCGLAFASKGYKDAARKCEKCLTEALLEASNGGELPILSDMSSCLLHMKETQPKFLKLFEPIEFTLTFLAPHLKFNKSSESIIVHPVCSAKNLGLDGHLMTLAGMCAEKVVSTKIDCCGFAGDKGFWHPELNRHGLRHIGRQLPAEAKRGFSTNRTCEIGLSEESGVPFTSILYLVEECTRG